MLRRCTCDFGRCSDDREADAAAELPSLPSLSAASASASASPPQDGCEGGTDNDATHRAYAPLIARRLVDGYEATPLLVNFSDGNGEAAGNALLALSLLLVVALLLC